MKSSVLIALLGLTSGAHLEKRHRHHRRPTQLVSFVDGDFHDNSDLSVPLTLMQHHNPYDVMTHNTHDLGVRFVQQGSDPIHGSLGPPPSRTYTPNADQKLEMELRQYKPRAFEFEEQTVNHTANSIKVAEKLVGAKMA